MKILCSTGCLCTMKNGRDRALIGKTAPFLHADGFEFMMYGSWYEKWQQVRDDVLAMNVRIPVMHVEKRIGERITVGEAEGARRSFRINARMAAELGAQKLVMHLWDGRPSDSNIDANYAEYAALRDIAAEYGVLLTVENVVCINSTPLDHLSRLHAMYPDISFTYDFKMARFHGQVEKTFSDEYMWLWNGPVKHVHFSDFGGAPMEWSALRSLHPGEGNIDFEYICRNLKSVGYDGYITIESTSVNDDGSIQVEKLNRSIDLIRKLTAGGTPAKGRRPLESCLRDSVP